jgi:hypothetical protein
VREEGGEEMEIGLEHNKEDEEDDEEGKAETEEEEGEGVLFDSTITASIDQKQNRTNNIE